MVERTGFEPVRLSDLFYRQAVSAAHTSLHILVKATGFEPATSGIRGQHSTTELRPEFLMQARGYVPPRLPSGPSDRRAYLSRLPRIPSWGTRDGRGSFKARPPQARPLHLG